MGVCHSNSKNEYEENKVQDIYIPSSLMFNEPINSIVTWKEGGIIMGSIDGTVRVLTQEGNVQYTIKVHDKSITQVVRDKKEKHVNVYTASRDCTIGHTTIMSNEERTVQHPSFKGGHELTISAIDVQDNLTLVSGGRDTILNIWDITTKEIIMKNTTTSRNVITCIKWNEQNVFVQGSEDLKVRIWDTRTSLLKPVDIINDYIYFPLSIDVSECHNYILTSSKGFNGVGCEGRLIDKRTLKTVQTFIGHNQDTTACLLLPNYTSSSSSSSLPFAVTASKDSTIKLWDGNNNKPIVTVHDAGSMFTSICTTRGTAQNEIFHIWASTFSGKILRYECNPKKKLLNKI